MPRLFALLCCFLVTTPAPATAPETQPNTDITGIWKGDLFQNEDGIAPRFDLTLQLVQDGLFVSGTGYVALDDLYLEMKLSGYQLPNGTYKLQETEILRDRKPDNLLWCFKGYELTLGYTATGETLTGVWWGNTSEGRCIPGSISLRRKIKRA